MTTSYEYIDAHRNEINNEIKATLGQLDGSDTNAISMMIGVGNDEFNDLGGLSR